LAAALTEMTALHAHRRGGPEVLVVERAPVPAPGDPVASGIRRVSEIGSDATDFKPGDVVYRLIRFDGTA
jgi:NADPH:quinone reductase-like Zn-dependent oxidoreductase